MERSKIFDHDAILNFKQRFLLFGASEYPLRQNDLSIGTHQKKADSRGLVLNMAPFETHPRVQKVGVRCTWGHVYSEC